MDCPYTIDQYNCRDERDYGIANAPPPAPVAGETAGLVERLRDDTDGLTGGTQEWLAANWALRNEAASALVSMQAERDAAVTKIKELEQELEDNAAFHFKGEKELHQAIEHWQDRTKAAEARADALQARVDELTREKDEAEARLAILLDRIEYTDSYGVPGSEFMSCHLCGEGSPGKPFEHQHNCPAKDLAHHARVWLEENRERGKYREALTNIASQRTTEQMDDEDKEAADFEGGYDTCVITARNALSSVPAHD